MKKRFSMTLTVLLMMCLLIFGCGSNSSEIIEVISEQTEEVAQVKVPISQEAQEEETTTEELTTDTENLFVEEDEISTESAEESEELTTESEEELSDEEKELFWQEYKGDVRDVYDLYETLHQLDDGGMNGAVKVPDEVKEEYEKRIEEGFIYEPEKVHNYYTAYSDAHIIEMVNARYLELHNEKRKELGLDEFEEIESLHDIATIRAEEASYFFNHTRPNGEWYDELIPWDGVSYQSYSENVAWSLGSEVYIDYYYGSKSIMSQRAFYIDRANGGFEGLWNSPPHHATIVNPEYKYIGIDSYIFRNKYGAVMIVTAFEFANDVF